MRKKIFLIIIGILLISCTNERERKLREKISAEISITENDKKLPYETLLIQNAEYEYKFNKQYVEELEKLTNDHFESQLEKFEDEELGFFSNWQYIFSYITFQGDVWKDELRLKSEKYFNPLNLEQEIQEFHSEYAKKITALRQQVISKCNVEITIAKSEKFDLPKQVILLDDLKSHTRNNLIIEIGFEYVIIPIVFLVIGILLSRTPWTKAGRVILLFDIILSTYFSIQNDKKMLDSIRKQYDPSIYEIKYDAIKKKLDDNTFKFYKNYE